MIPLRAAIPITATRPINVPSDTTPPSAAAATPHEGEGEAAEHQDREPRRPEIGQQHEEDPDQGQRRDAEQP